MGRHFNARVDEMKRCLVDLKSKNHKQYENLEKQHNVRRNETFGSLADRRKRQKIEKQTRQNHGRHPAEFDTLTDIIIRLITQRDCSCWDIERDTVVCWFDIISCFQ